jgi:hypothetical protein
MIQPWHCDLRGTILLTVIVCLLCTESSLASPPRDKKKIPAVRWNEQSPGCTFSRGTDGKLRYGLWQDDIGITLAVDAQELEKVHRRHEAFFAVLLEVRYRGPQSLDFSTENISLEFVKHSQVVQTSLDPDGFSQKIQNDADALNDQFAREVRRNPEKKEEKEAYMRAYLKDTAQLQEFVGKNSLRPAHLDSANPQVSGWVLFSTKSKWIGEWKKQEDLVVRVPVNGTLFEFPFTLPPKAGEVLLRKRE